ncbi:MAG: HAD domain-containing protein [Rhodoferax sp.]
MNIQTIQGLRSGDSVAFYLGSCLASGRTHCLTALSTTAWGRAIRFSTIDFFNRENEMRALFLDFDGVAHPVSAIAGWQSMNLGGSGIERLIEERDLFRWLPILSQALESHPDVLLVVHSGWRGIADNTCMQAILGRLSDRFIGVTDLQLRRHDGIEFFARRAQMDHYLVIDDAIREFPPGFKYLLATDPQLGLSQASVQRALAEWLLKTSPSKQTDLTAELML